MKKIIVAGIAVLLLFSLAQPIEAQAQDVTVTIDGRHVAFPAQTPVIVEGRTLVPVRGVFDTLGFDLRWDDITRQAVLTKESHTVIITIGSSEFTTNGVSHFLDVPAQIIGNSTMIPIGTVLRSVGLDLTWEDATRTVQITVPPVASVLVEPVPMPALPVPIVSFAGTGSHGAMVAAAYAQFNLPSGLAALPSGEILVADKANNALRAISQAGAVRLFAGTIDIAARDNFPFGFYLDANSGEAGFNRPMGIAVCESGAVFITDSQNHSIRIATGGQVRTFAGGNGAGHTNGGPNAARFNSPADIAICPDGYLIVADTLNHVIRRVDSEGNVTTIAGRPGIFGSADGNASAAMFDSPMGVIVDYNGRIFVADTGNHVIRLIENGVVTTIAGAVRQMPVADRDGHPDRWDMNPLGGFQDGFAAEAQFNKPVSLALWDGNLLIADSANHAIRMLAPTGEVVTLAGTGYPGLFEGSLPTFHLPRGVYVRDGYLYIADTGNNMIRRLRLSF